ncbi:hypothetical protein ACFS27_13495 [Promicromonospora vindobonensis]|uniref:Uncharacterized protein n=1 Tax=Promicromonospora vindobonensis TaxID=195748 RepID=A0ABW5VTI0_9MICO
MTAHLTERGVHVAEGEAGGELLVSISLEPEGSVGATIAIVNAVRPTLALWTKMDGSEDAEVEQSLALLGEDGTWHCLRFIADIDLDEEFDDLAGYDDTDTIEMDGRLSQFLNATVTQAAAEVSIDSFHDRWTLERRVLQHLGEAVENAPNDLRAAFERRERRIGETVRERIKIEVEDLHIKQIRHRAGEYAQGILDSDPSLLTATKPHRRGVVNRCMKLEDGHCMTVDSADVVVAALEELITRRGTGQSLF